MRHILFKKDAKPPYKVALLIKDSAFKEKDLRREYINKSSISDEGFIAFNLKYDINGKAPVSKVQRPHLSNLLAAIDALGVKIIYVCDAAYFKTLTNERKAEPFFGYIKDCAIKGYEHLKVTLGVNHQGLFYNPALQTKIDYSMQVMEQYLLGIYIEPGTTIIHQAHYPVDCTEISNILFNVLMHHDALTCDIETFSLDLNTAGIATIAFAWNKNEGAAFCCDYIALGCAEQNIPIRSLLKRFFEEYKGKLIYHGSTFDIKMLIFNLWMEDDALNYKGMLEGIEVMTRLIDDTKIIAYLATNSATRINRSLKDLSQEYTGNYAQDDIKDVLKIEKEALLQYNLVDCLATWYVHDVYYPIMVADQQLNVYNKIMLPSIKNILQMELVGMPIDLGQVRASDKELQVIQQDFNQQLFAMQLVKDFIVQLQKRECTTKNLLLKVKIKPLSDFDDVIYNPASNKQTRQLLYDELGMDIIDFTDTGEAAVGAKTLKKLIANSTDPQHTLLLKNLIGLSEVSIIKNTFIKSFYRKSFKKSNGEYYLHGNFNLGGTVSGRLSSNDPNLQNIPSTGTIYAKAIKKCFKAPPGWIMMGADFSSLEDRISALTTKDPNKLKVYEQGYDGHCLRAFSYFGDQMTGITDTVESINSIATKYPELRQNSKAPTFLLTYGGTTYGLEQTVGLSAKEAYRIDTNYHKLYKASDTWVAAKLEKATKDGYVTVAFDLRVRTPVLSQTYLNKSSTPKETRAESRTAGNALGQSYGLLTNRAGIEFQQRTLNSKYALDIMPIAHIHDALYFIVKDTYGVVKWFNDNLIECMQWQDLPELEHPTVKLGGEVDIFYPSWNESYTLPNKVSKHDIKLIIEKKP